MKKIIALMMALVLVLTCVAIAEATTATTETAEAAVEETVEETAEEAVEETEETAEEATEEAVEETAEEATEEAAEEVVEEPVHEHEWNFVTRTCEGCEEAIPCFDDETKPYVHTFVEGVCEGCGAAEFCGVEGHEGHTLAECGVPGHYTCDEMDHTTWRFDDEKHTVCLGVTEHVCEDGCGATYTCDHANSHTVCIVCGNLWCYKAEGDHTEAKCGHRYCEMGEHPSLHDKCKGCGQYKCNGKSHKNCTTTSAPAAEPTDAPTTEPPVEYL
ncbi:MAG: hypothetical protein MJ099_05535 [Clostridia bacterium]|nr:hypothetical protein [Clostridia bacterium]